MSSKGAGAVTDELDQQSGHVPKLRFPEFRDAGEWSSEKLGELTTSVTPPKKLPTSLYAVSGNFPIIDQSQDFVCGRTDDSEAVIDKGSPLIIFGDHTCALKFIDFPFAQGADGIKILSAKTNISIEFLYHSLLHKPLVMRDYRRHFSILKNRSVQFPDIKSGEQHKIADCLSSIDTLIAVEVERLEALKDHKKGLMQRLFPAPGETTPRLRFPEFQSAGDWKERLLGEICEIAQGYGFPEALQGKPRGDFPFCKVSDISRAVSDKGGVLDSAVNYVDLSDLKILRAKTIPAGATVFAKIGEALRLNRRAISGVECLIDNNAVALKAKSGVAADYFVFLLSQMIDMNEHCGGAVPSVNKSTLEGIGVIIPQPKEQQKIAEYFSSCNAIIALQADRIDALKAHKTGLMQQLFPAPAKAIA